MKSELTLLHTKIKISTTRGEKSGRRYFSAEKIPGSDNSAKRNCQVAKLLRAKYAAAKYTAAKNAAAKL